MKYIVLNNSDGKINFIKSTLKKNDSIYITKSYVECYKRLLLDKYDALILEINVPLCDDDVEIKKYGLLLIEELEKNNMNIPIIVYSTEEINVKLHKNVIGYIKDYGFEENINYEKGIRKLLKRIRK